MVESRKLQESRSKDGVADITRQIGMDSRWDAQLAALLLLSCAALYLWESWPLRYLMDDAYISMRYAYNWSHGHGLVFNPGERVEGYTNFLWTAIIAAGMKLGADGVALVHRMSVLSGLFLLGSSWWLTRTLLPGRRSLAALAPLLLLSSNAFADAYSSGLETTLYAALVTLAVAASLSGKRWQTLWLLILATLTRPDGVMVAGIIWGLPFLWVLVQRDGKLARGWLREPLVYAGFLLVLTACRWHYYHDLLPNTFYAKVGGLPLRLGLLYLRNNIASGLLLLLPGALLYSVRHSWRDPLPTLVGAYALYVVIVRGDPLGHGRFLLCIEPLLIGMSLHSLATVQRPLTRGVLALLLLAQVPWNLYALPSFASDFSQDDDRQFPHSGKREQALDHNVFGGQLTIVRLCKTLQDKFPHIHSIATVGIGLEGYCLEGRTIIDLVGLVDRTIARSDSPLEHDQRLLLLPGHQRTNAAYVMQRQPDAIQISRFGTATRTLPCIQDLWTNSDFQRHYIWNEKLSLYLRRP